MISKSGIKVWFIIVLLTCSTKVAGNEPDYNTPPEKVAEFREKALKGDPIAQYELAWLTTLGWAGVAKDKDKAKALFMRSAEQGYDEAQLMVASCYMSGEFTGIIDLPEAASWLHKAAKQGNTEACFHLANIYLEGNEIFRLVLELDNNNRTKLEPIRQNKEIGEEFWPLAGLSKSEIELLYALHARIAKGDWRAHKEIAKLLSDSAPKKLRTNLYSEIHLLQHERHLFDHNLREASNGDITAMLEVARKHRSPGCPGHPDKSPEEEVKWLNKAAQGGSIDALYELGSFYSQSEESKDSRKSFDYYMQAAIKGDARAMCSLASIYEAREDLHESTRWMIKAAEAGDSASWFYVGHRYQNGKGIPVNFVKAYAWFSISSSEEKERPDSVPRRRLKELSALMTAEQIAEGQKLAEQIWQNLDRKLSSNHKLTAEEKLENQVRLDLERAKLRSK
jgi:TPR repeat protein